MKKILFHLHTSYSDDCMVSPQRLVERARELSADTLVICDRDTIAGAMEARAYAKEQEIHIKIPIAATFETDVGDIIVVGLPEDFSAVHYCNPPSHLPCHDRLIREAKRIGAWVVLPHPYTGHRLKKITPAAIEAIDSIEVFNSRCTDDQNRSAAELAQQWNKHPVYGSDAHYLRETQAAVCLYDGSAFVGTGPKPTFVPVQLRQISPFVARSSLIIKSAKTRKIAPLRSAFRLGVQDALDQIRRWRGAA